MGLYSDVFRFMTASAAAQWKFKNRKNLDFYLKYWRRALDERPPFSMYATYAIEQHYVVDRPVITLRFRHGGPRKHVLFLHGGSYINPMGLVHWQFIQRLMKNAGCNVSAPLYGLAPRYTFRDAYPLLHEHYLELLDEVAPEDIMLLGDSAGGGLALSFAQWINEKALPRPGGVVMISPWLDITLSNPDINEVQPRDKILAVPGNREAGRLWADGEDPRDPRLSPLYGPITNLPPLYLLIGTDDILLPDARRLRQQAEAANVPMRYEEFLDMFHLWALLPTQEGFEAVERIQSFVTQPAQVH